MIKHFKLLREFSVTTLHYCCGIRLLPLPKVVGFRFIC
nr:MAG TPA: hypothetical protein [Caudoviricetes sp.]